MDDVLDFLTDSCFYRFDRTSPEKYYSIMEKIGQGGYSTVYRCVKFK